jgi:hypothetical protein
MEIHDLRVSDDEELFAQHIALMQEGVAKHPRELIATKYEMSPVQIREQIARKELGIALSMLDGVAYGTITIYYPVYHKRRHKATISSMYVRSIAYARAVKDNPTVLRTHRLGHLLTLHMLKRAQKLGFETVISNTATDNAHIQQINESLGGVVTWKEMKGMKLTDGSYVDTLNYEFDLQKLVFNDDAL